MDMSVFFCLLLDKVGPKLRPPACQKHKDEGQPGHSLFRSSQSSCAAGRRHFLPSCTLSIRTTNFLSHTPALLILLFLLHKGQAEGGSDAASLPSIWCRMPLSGCQPAHGNEGCHQGYCRLEHCLGSPRLFSPSEWLSPPQRIRCPAKD